MLAKPSTTNHPKPDATFGATKVATAATKARVQRASVVLALAVPGSAAMPPSRQETVIWNILGVSAAGSLRAAVTIFCGAAARAVWRLPAGAFAGAAATRLLVGVAVGGLNVSFTTFILSVSLSSHDVGRAGAILVHARELDALLLGEVTAPSIGVDLPRVRLVLILSTSLLIGAAVAAAGPIGSVGSTHRGLLAAAFLGGGIFLVLADLAARTLLAPMEIPVGVITAALGAPFFLVLLVRRGQDDLERREIARRAALLMQDSPLELPLSAREVVALAGLPYLRRFETERVADRAEGRQ